MQYDTIAAISTPAGSGGIGIVRISGADSLTILSRLFRAGRAVEDIASHTITYGTIVHNGRPIDEVLVSVMRAPRTYTREDVVEINCHGGILPISQVLRAVLECGARHAEPGEFTKRAFLNGRIGLSQAEAVIDVINARTSMALSVAGSQLRGSLARRLESVSDELVEMLARIEVSIDYPEHDEAEVNLRHISSASAKLADSLRELADSFESGRNLREGVRTLILGRPNVGKSSLLNHLLQHDRAIVTDIPGTTRDLLSENVNIGGVPLVVTDTAGYRQTNDPIERIGVDRSLEQLPAAQLVLLMLDGSRDFSPEDKELIARTSGKPLIVIINKADLTSCFDDSLLITFCAGLAPAAVIRVSLKTGQGMDALHKQIFDMFNMGEIDADNAVIITNLRHEQALRAAISSLENASAACDNGLPEDIAAIELMSAASSIGEITGRTLSEDIVDRIFSEFCLGK
ncbi:MAG: tRNA uridine-5-carboxymethylaminomethyl(34) synthesis GTPase MnmE [Defluviitaleaceae bacterium]|nr:tRNA uridine-5-carboxymethylaminomethyl(34) synthesis GTPase MnmE [Defluviitaleaceae bacterium]